MHEYPQYPDGQFGDAVPRAGNASGGGQPGAILKCKGWETDPNAYIYFITQAAVWPAICKVIGEPGWIEDEAYKTPRGAAAPEADLQAHRAVDHEQASSRPWTFSTSFDIPCGPILSMKEIAYEPSLRATGTVVEVDHPERGKYLTVGNPIKLSDSPTDVTRSPLLGEHTDEVLTQMGFDDSQVAALRAEGAV